jgi:hypothetical protein
MFETKKATHVLADLGHLGISEPVVFESVVNKVSFSLNNFQICFNPVETIPPEVLIIIEQLLRFEEVLPLKDWCQLNFREFDNFMRDQNSTPSVDIKNARAVQKSFDLWKKSLTDIIRVKKGLDIIKQSIGSLGEISFIDACVKISETFKTLHLEGVFIHKEFYRIKEYNSKDFEITFQIETSMAVSNFEVELLKIFGESIDGIRKVKMVAGES